MTEFNVPRWRMPFPSLPTLFGRRPASRRCRKQWLREKRYAWVGAAAAHAMRQHARIMAAGPRAAEPDWDD